LEPTELPSHIPTEMPPFETSTTTDDGLTELVSHSWSGTGSIMSKCEGDCDSDTDCQGTMECFQNDGYDVPPGCTGTVVNAYDYCYDPSDTSMAGLTQLVDLGWTPTTSLDECEGDCDDDSDCDTGLQCWHDSTPPGCTGSYTQAMDYCYDPTWGVTTTTTSIPSAGPTFDPTLEPTSIPTEIPTEMDFESTYDDMTPLQNMGWNPDFTLTECQGDCDDDSDCEDGLVCWQRMKRDDGPPGCSGTPDGSMDYCYDPKDTIHSASIVQVTEKWGQWIGDEIKDHIPKAIPTVTLMVFVAICVLVCAFFRCCLKRKTKAYQKVGFEDEMPSDTDTDSDVALPMNL